MNIKISSMTVLLSILLAACGGGGGETGSDTSGDSSDTGSGSGTSVSDLDISDDDGSLPLADGLGLILKAGDTIALSQIVGKATDGNYYSLDAMGYQISNYDSAVLTLNDGVFTVSSDISSASWTNIDFYKGEYSSGLYFYAAPTADVELAEAIVAIDGQVFGTDELLLQNKDDIGVGLCQLATLISSSGNETELCYPVVSVDDGLPILESGDSDEGTIELGMPDGSSLSPTLVTYSSFTEYFSPYFYVDETPVVFGQLPADGSVAVTAQLDGDLEVDVSLFYEISGTSVTDDSATLVATRTHNNAELYDGVQALDENLEDKFALLEFDQIGASSNWLYTAPNTPVSISLYGQYLDTQWDITDKVSNFILNIRDDMDFESGYDDSWDSNWCYYERRYLSECASFEEGQIATNAEGIFSFQSYGVSGISDRLFTLEVGSELDDSLEGLWQYVENGSNRRLGAYASGEGFTQMDDNTLQDLESGQYLVRAGIDDVAVTGSLSEVLESESATASGFSVLATRAVGSSFFTISSSGGFAGIGSIDTILTPLLGGDTVTLTTDEEGGFSGEVESGDYLLTSEVEIDTDGDGETELVSVETEVTISGESTDLGNFTLVEVEDYNFDASLSEPPLIFFGRNNNDQAYRYYTDQALVVSNTGRSDISGARARLTISSGDDLVNSMSLESGGTVVSTDDDGYFLLGGLSAGDSKELALNILFFRPDEDTEVELTFEIMDSSDRVWTDRITLPVSANPPVKVNVYAANSGSSGSVYGYIVTPGRTLVRLDVSTGSASYDLPFLVGDSYDIVFSNSSATTESAYGIGIGTEVNSSELASFTDVNRYEATDGSYGDNVPSGATELEYGDSDISYLSSGDIDFVRFNMTAAAQPE